MTRWLFVILVGVACDAATSTALDAASRDAEGSDGFLADAAESSDGSLDAMLRDAAQTDATLVVDTGAYHHLVAKTVDIPRNSFEVEAYALNVDGDSGGLTENRWGEIFIALQAQGGIRINEFTQVAVDSGAIILLHSVRADSLADDPSVSWQIYDGETSPPGLTPDYSGGGTFQVASGSELDAVLVGSTTGSRFRGGLGQVAVKIALTDNAAPPVVFPLIAARLDVVSLSDTACSGRLGAAVASADVDTILSSWLERMNTVIASDPGSDCPSTRSTCKASTQAILNAFDGPNSGATPPCGPADGCVEDDVITIAEVKSNDLLLGLSYPDLDLFDAAGRFAPNSDGVRDSISFGIGFSCSSGTFTVAGEGP